VKELAATFPSDAEGRIFVGRLDAELVCIAGRYLISDEIAPEFRDQAEQVTLIQDGLSISRSGSSGALATQARLSDDSRGPGCHHRSCTD